MRHVAVDVADVVQDVVRMCGEGFLIARLEELTQLVGTPDEVAVVGDAVWVIDLPERLPVMAVNGMRIARDAVENRRAVFHKAQPSPDISQLRLQLRNLRLGHAVAPVSGTGEGPAAPTLETRR